MLQSVAPCLPMYVDSSAYSLRTKILHGITMAHERIRTTSSPVEDGTVHLRLHVTELSAVTKWILSFGRNAVALEPPELVELIREELHQMQETYSPLL